MAARSMWNGAVVIGTAVIPVKVFAATESHTPQFRELHDADGEPIEHKLVGEDSGREVSRDKVAKAYETSQGKMVVLSDEEIRAVEAPKRRAIDVEAFVPADQLDPVFHDRAYYLGAGDGGEDGLKALSKAMETRDVVAVGRVVLRRKEQLVALRPGDGVLRMSTLRYFDEVVDPASVDVDEPEKAPTKREQQMAAQLVEGLTRKFRASSYEDEHRERVDAYAKAKAKGEAPELDNLEDVEETDDLLAALKASLEGAKG